VSQSRSSHDWRIENFCTTFLQTQSFSIGLNMTPGLCEGSIQPPHIPSTKSAFASSVSLYSAFNPKIPTYSIRRPWTTRHQIPHHAGSPSSASTTTDRRTNITNSHNHDYTIKTLNNDASLSYS